jgi:hypothetical protein
MRKLALIVLLAISLIIIAEQEKMATPLPTPDTQIAISGDTPKEPF